MRLGTQTGSLINHLEARATIGQPTPEVGMGVTMLGWTDRSPGTIFSVQRIGRSTIIEVRADDYKRTDSNGMSEGQEYTYTTNPQGHAQYFRAKDEDAEWVSVRKSRETGRWVKTGRTGLRIGQRERYYDFSF